jgi:hypothetical protein
MVMKRASFLALTTGGIGVAIAAFTAHAASGPPVAVKMEGSRGTVVSGPDSLASPHHGDRDGVETFTIDSMSLGEGIAWKSYGADLDGMATVVASQDVCTLQPGSRSVTQRDGNGGIDNSFGENLVPLLTDLTATPPSVQVGNALTSGAFTFTLRVSGLSDDPAQTATGLAGDLQVRSDDDSRNGGLRIRLGQGGDDSSVHFTNGTVTQGKFLASLSSLRLTVAVSGRVLTLPLNRAVISFQHVAIGTASNGTIAGVIPTSDLVNAVARAAGGVSPSVLPPAALATSLHSLRAASDILSDGTNRAGVPCDGISFGIGFAAVPKTGAARDGIESRQEIAAP